MARRRQHKKAQKKARQRWDQKAVQPIANEADQLTEQFESVKKVTTPGPLSWLQVVTMAAGGSGPQATGPDYLMMVAQKAEEHGQPYSAEFSTMIYEAFSPTPGGPGILGQLPTERIAARELDDHEATPVAIIATALTAAADTGDVEAFQEVLQVGLSLLAKWPNYLMATVTGHPTLDIKLDDELDS